MLLDFANAFNTVDRNLMLRLTAAHCPELTNLVRWLYKLEPHLVTAGGDTVKSSTGTQQGCTLSNPLFALIMEYFAKKLVIDGLRVKQFYWDDTALVGTPEAVSKALEVIRSLSTETGLNLKWKKCHLYGTPELVEVCKTLKRPSFPNKIVIHESYDMIYLKAPIGCDRFVARWLKSKLSELEIIIAAISRMPFKHEGFTLLKNCAAECRVMYLMRVIPPRQLDSFMKDFDQLLKKGFEELLGTTIGEKWWRQAQLPPKFGGMAVRSGLRTHGAQHLCSLAKCADDVDRIVGGWNAVEVARRETEAWLNNACEEVVDIEVLVTRLRSEEEDRANDWFAGLNYHYSLAQLCELNEQKNVSRLMSSKERLHIEAHSGLSHAWVTLLPLSFKKYNLSSPDWIAAARRRLMLNVFPCQKHCTFCKGGWCDVKGDHASMCGGGSSRVLRHNTIRNILAKAVRDVGFRTDIEHGGGLGDQRRPGDIIVYNWRDGRHLLIDVAVINPMCSSNMDSLISEGVGGAAEAYGIKKERTYHDLDFTKYDFLPFIMETTGGLSTAAYGFCKEIKKLHDLSSYHNMVDTPYNYEINPLLSAINVELQRANSRMILERIPVLGSLIYSAMVKCEIAVSKKKEDAIESLRLARFGPTRVHRVFRARPNCEHDVKFSGQGSMMQELVDFKIKKSIGKEKKKKSMEKKSKRNLTPMKSIKSTESGIQCASSLKGRPNPSPPSAKPTVDPFPLHPKPPDEVNIKDMNMGVATMEWETEDRILALKSNTSQNSSTSVVGNVLLHTDSDWRREPQGQSMDQKHTSAYVWVSSSQVDKVGEETARAHWEPPFNLPNHQE